MSDEWWVMEIEWRKLSDQILLAKQALSLYQNMSVCVCVFTFCRSLVFAYTRFFPSSCWWHSMVDWMPSCNAFWQLNEATWCLLQRPYLLQLLVCNSFQLNVRLMVLYFIQCGLSGRKELLGSSTARLFRDCHYMWWQS